jgi:hypothetical protein
VSRNDARHWLAFTAADVPDMHLIRCGIIAIAASLSVGCAPEPHSPGAILIEDETSVRQEDTLSLCQAFGVNSQKIYGANGLRRIRDELTRREALTQSYWTLVDRREIGIGMSECGVLAAWGVPNQVRRNVTTLGEEVQFIYPGRRVFLVGGRVRSFRTVD